jgi:hypothetical protein
MGLQGLLLGQLYRSPLRCDRPNIPNEQFGQLTVLLISNSSTPYRLSPDRAVSMEMPNLRLIFPINITSSQPRVTMTYALFILVQRYIKPLTRRIQIHHF